MIFRTRPRKKQDLDFGAGLSNVNGKEARIFGIKCSKLAPLRRIAS
jgi:hypothetical protein